MRSKCSPVCLLVASALLFVLGCSPKATSRGESDDAPGSKSSDESSEPETTPKDQNVIRQRIEEAITNVRGRELNTTHGFWTIFHGILGLGPHDCFLKDPKTGLKHNAVDYICAGNPVKGMTFEPTADGLEVVTASTPDTLYIAQGHQDQFIAEMTQWGMPLDREFLVRDKKYTFESFVNNAKRRASLHGDQELSWTVLVVGNYFGTNYEWTNKDGYKLSIEDLVRFELDASMDTAACGGTHRLFDLSWLYHLHLKHGGKTEGIWKRVAENAAHYQELARKYQNLDSSFSTDFFKGRGDVPDLQRRINTSGHILEWLALSLTDEQLREPWVEAAAYAVARMIVDLRGDPMEGASLYHAVHGLIIYHGRIFQPDKFTHDFDWVPLKRS